MGRLKSKMGRLKSKMGRLKSKMGECVEQKRKAKWVEKKQILSMPNHQAVSALCYEYRYTVYKFA